MAEEVERARPTLGDRLQSVNRGTLYLLLFAVVTVPLIFTWKFNIVIPCKPESYTKETYTLLRNIGDGDTIIIDTGWTNSTRGENGMQLEALLRMVMRQKVKFVLYTTVDPQSTEIARNVIRRINEERKAKGQYEYREWDDYVEMGYFTDPNSMLQAMASNLRQAWKGRMVRDVEGNDHEAFSSPPLAKIQKIEDFKAYVTIAASSIMPTIVARVGRKVPVVSMITGVMFPEQYNYYQSGQLKGVVNGLAGTVELEWLMEKGIDGDGVVGGPTRPYKAAPFPGEINLKRGMTYYLPFQCSLTLLILAVLIGNLGMYLNRKRGTA